MRVWPIKIFPAVALSVTLLCEPVGASEDPKADAWELIDQGRDLSAIERFRAVGFHPNGTIADEAAAETWAQLFPRLNGLTVPTTNRPAFDGPPAEARDVAAIATAERRDAIASIVSLLKDRRVVILNEAHDDPQDRAFGLAVAKALRPLGFSYLAVETFNNSRHPERTDIARLIAQGYPIRSTGAYIGDPVFGDFVRQALALGYRPLAYEQTSDEGAMPSGGIDAREEAQASNLAAAITHAPMAKFLIYVGYSHAAKTPVPAEASGQSHLWMAGRLKLKTGIDPLTIDQTQFGATNEAQASQSLRKLAQRGGTSSIVLFSGGKPLLFGKYRAAVDLQVIHPVTRIAHGRPDWLRTLSRRPVRPRADLVPRSGRSLVQAFLSDEPDGAVPVDQVVLEPYVTRWFMLPNRQVRFVVKEHLP